MTKITKRISGICPITDKRQTIAIDFFEVRSIGMLAPRYKKGSFSCSASTDDTIDICNSCPIYKSANAE